MKALLYIATFLLWIQHSDAATIDVCADCETNSIREGVVLAKAGDTVLVRAGIYYVSEIVIDKSISLIGIDQPVLDGQNLQKNILEVRAQDVLISGFLLQNVGLSYTKEIAGIHISHSKNFRMTHNTFQNVFYAFILQRAQYGLLKNNVIRGQSVDETKSGNGFHLWKCTDIRIESNTIEGMRDGIYLEFVKNSHISNNRSRKNIRYGLHFMFSDHNEYHHNEFRENGAGVAVMFSKFIQMHHNDFQYNWGTASYGLLLKEINDSEIMNNNFEQNTIGINIDGCNRINYRGNQFVRNGWAIRFTGGCYTNIFEYNNFRHNTFDLSYNSRLNDNKFEANYWSEYTGYDLDRDGIGDVAFRPVKLFSFVVNKTPETIILMRSLFVDLINFSEKVSPIFTPDALKDIRPLMKPIVW